MKASLFQLVSSSVVLGLMAGAVGLQWYQLRSSKEMVTTVEGVRHLPAGEKGGGLLPVSWPGSDNAPEPRRARTPSDRPEMDATVTALNEIVSVLRELKDENRDLREQVEEANRDLTEMQFRIDTHSRSFRPLKVTGEPAGPMEMNAGHPLLGLKPQR